MGQFVHHSQWSNRNLKSGRSGVSIVSYQRWYMNLRLHSSYHSLWQLDCVYKFHVIVCHTCKLYDLIGCRQEEYLDFPVRITSAKLDFLLCRYKFHDPIEGMKHWIFGHCYFHSKGFLPMNYNNILCVCTTFKMDSTILVLHPGRTIFPNIISSLVWWTEGYLLPDTVCNWSGVCFHIAFHRKFLLYTCTSSNSFLM